MNELIAALNEKADTYQKMADNREEKRKADKEIIAMYQGMSNAFRISSSLAESAQYFHAK